MALLAFLMMQVSVDEIIRMIAMRNCLVAATGAVLMTAAVDLGRMCDGVLRVNRKYMFIDMPFMNMVHVPIMQVIGMAVMLDSGVPAA